jgi:coniferyl-aldehyde dehydrogenase
MLDVLARQKEANLAEPFPSADVRIDRLRRLESILVNNQRAWVEALDADFGGRPGLQTRMEIYGALGPVRHAIKHVRTWIRPQKRPLPLLMRLTGARAEVFHQPLGTVGVVAPWNFPLVLSIGALGSVFSAGNRAMLKPSELTPVTSRLLEDQIARSFEPTELGTVIGGAEVGAAFSQLPFDHLLFTGAPSVARHVMRAAADNLVPVTLELGGKCPAILGKEADLDLAVDRIMWGKIQNAGQICLAPDYVFVPRGREKEFVDRARQKVASWYRKASSNPDFCAIINDRHHARLKQYIDQAKSCGVKVEVLTTDHPDGIGGTGDRRIPPMIFLEPDQSLGIMQDEVFGPLLSLYSYSHLDEVISFINARDRPLALYYFGSDSEAIRQLKQRTTSGGVTVNDIAAHAAVETLPLGGVGTSGMGRYHGYDGFLNFSHAKAVLNQRGISLGRLFNPPYNDRKARMLDRAIGKPVG